MAFFPCPKPSVQSWYFSVTATVQQSPQALGLQMLPELAPHHCPALSSGSSFGTIPLVPIRASTVVATAIDSQLTTDEQLQLLSAGLCTTCVLCADVLNNGSQFHTLPPSSVDLLRQLGILNGGN